MTVLTLDGLTKTFQRSGTVVDGVNLRIESGEFFTLLGPSGCGKSTILRMIAGFETPDTGRVLFNDKDVTRDPPNRRGIGMVFQNYALFPHLPVRRNVAFGLEVQKVAVSERERRVSDALREVRLSDRAEARVDQLSGGQQQRVALARALVMRPSLLLLDEPLSNLDAKLREETRAMLRALHVATGVTTVYVTHDQSEAMGMSGRIAVLRGGKVQQMAEPAMIYERPANRFVAGFIGRNNVLDAVVVRMSEHTVHVRLSTGLEFGVDREAAAPEVDLAPGAAVGVCFRAEALRPSADGPIAGAFVDVEYTGPAHSCLVQTDLGDLRVEIPAGQGRPSRGDAVRLALPSTVHLVGPEL